MKKVLFATTALVASAGIASAQGVEISGGAEMGIVGGEVGGVTTELQFFTSIDVRFAMSGETDNGLTFGAQIDLDDAVDHAILGFDHIDSGPGQFADYTVFISGRFGTLTIGDTDGAFDAALTEVSIGGGSINDAETSHNGYSGNAGLDGLYDGQVARYTYSFSGITVHASAEIDDVAPTGDPVLGIGASYSGDLGGVTIGIGAGFQTAGTGNQAFGASGQVTFNSFSIVGNYTSVEIGGATTDGFAVGASYTFDAISVGANFGSYDVAGTTNSGFGGFANYDLGGGAVVQAGVGIDQDGGNDNFFSLGIAMSF